MNDSLPRGHRRMKISFKDVLVFVFVSIFLVQVYFGMAQTVEALQPANMVKSFRLSSLRGSSACNSFSVGDTLVLKASSEVAARYKMTILKEDVAIFETEGDYVNSSGEAKVSLNPPRFVVGIVYTAVLDSFSYNIPIIGVNYHDSKYAIFTVVETKTQLSVEVAYNGGFRSLKLVGNLTDVDGCPVFNETLLFEAKLYDRGRATDGWTPLGSSLTNESGIAEYTSALYVPDGNYSFRAFHNATSNFGESSDSKRISVSSNGTLVTGGNLAAASFDFEPDGWEEHGVFSFSPGVGQTTNALMYRKITVTYRTDLYFGNGALVEFFYFDHFKPGQPDGNTTLTRTYDGSVYTYTGCMDWVPDSVGTFFFMAGISSISVLNLTRAIFFGEFFDQGNSTLTVVPCPYSNVVLYSPMNNYDRSVRFTVALSKPRTYQTQSSGFFTSSALAPRVSYGGLEYTLDDPLSYYSIDVYVNGNDHVVTADQNGVATLSVVTSAGQDHLLL